MKIVLTSQEIEFMLANLCLTETLREKLEILNSMKNRGISDDLADQLRDLCADRLVTHGFDEDYNPTAEGNMLEDLIDKLFIRRP